MTVEELKIRRLANQYLIEPSEKLRVARALNGFQAQFMVNAIHSMRLRCLDFDERSFADGLVKNWTVRGTVHVFAESDMPLFRHCGGGSEYLLDQWRGYRTWRRQDGSYNHFDDGGCERVWALTPERQTLFAHAILDELQRSPRTREELKDICVNMGMTAIEKDCMFNQWGGGIGELCQRGFINYVVQEKKAYRLAPVYKPMSERDAKLEMARRYFTNIAPATVHDAQYYFHETAANIKDLLSLLPVSDFKCEGKTYFYIENGRSYDNCLPDCIFLAGFDQLMLGYEKKESVFLPQRDLRSIFNLAGIVMPSLLLRGTVAGKWRKKGGTLTITPFEAISARDKDMIFENAGRLWGDIAGIYWDE